MLRIYSRIGGAVAGHRQSAASWKSVRSSAQTLTQYQDRGISDTIIKWVPASVIEHFLTTLRG